MPRSSQEWDWEEQGGSCGAGGCGQRGSALLLCAPWLTGGPHLEFIASRRRKEEERRAGRAGSWGRRRRLCPPLSCPGSPTPGLRPSTANSLQNQPLAFPGRRRQGHSGQGRDPGRPSQVSARGKGEVPIWAGRGPLRPWDLSLGARPGVRRSYRRCTRCSRLCCTERTDHPLCAPVHHSRQLPTYSVAHPQTELPAFLGPGSWR